MIHFLTKRILYGFLVLLGAVLIVFVLFYIMPVNAARLTLGQRADVASVEAIEKELGLNLPWYSRIAKYMGEISPIAIHENTPEEQKRLSYSPLIEFGNSVLVVKQPYLGRSFQSRKLVMDILTEKIPSTLVLALVAIVIATFLGIIFGVIAAVQHNKLFDHIILPITNIGISTPSYFTSIVFAYLFGVLLANITGLNATGSLLDINDYGDTVIKWKNLILPAIALGIRPIAIITQLTRSSMLDVLSQDYIRTASAKGLSFFKVLYKHALRNALNPVVTSISGWFASLLAGAYFVETIFGYGGLGSETIRALQSFDLPVVMGSVLFTAMLFVIINIFVDIIYMFLDPRISVKSA